MYVVTSAIGEPLWSRDLNQGDIVADLLLPGIVAEKNLCVRNGSKIKWPAAPGDLAPLDPNAHVLIRVSKEPFALIVSNSCDNSAGELPLLVCPVRPFKFKDGWSDAEKWRAINVAATGTANTKQFYLPSNPTAGMPRSSAQLPLGQPLSHDYVTRCLKQAGARRVAALAPAGVQHLQRSLDMFHSRNPRDDHEWPSDDDFRLKIEFLRAEIRQGSARHEANIDELKSLCAKLGLTESEFS